VISQGSVVSTLLVYICYNVNFSIRLLESVTNYAKGVWYKSINQGF